MRLCSIERTELSYCGSVSITKYLQTSMDNIATYAELKKAFLHNLPANGHGRDRNFQIVNLKITIYFKVYFGLMTNNLYNR